MENSLSILLATYNGERYLAQQLDSLLEQSYQSFQIFIRDDGSSDNTIAIIKQYCKRFPFKVHLVPDKIKHRGAVGSFFYLLQTIDSDYYMFCDQDDVWLPDKILVTMKVMRDIESRYSHIPIVIHTDLFVVDQELNILYPSFWKKMKLKVELLQKFNYLATCNCVTGCTMLINKIAKQISLPYPSDCPMHDFWIALMSAKYGLVTNVPEPTILYRQHHSNVVGVQNRSVGYFLRILFSFKRTFRSQKRQIEFVQKIGYGSALKFLFYKILYTLRRNI